MLVVLNGAASINLSAFARNIVQTLNRLNHYQMDTFVVDYASVPIVARDAQGNIVYKEGDPDIEGVTTLRPEVEEEATVLARIIEFKNLILWTNRFGAVDDRYGDFRHDYNIVSEPTFEQDYQQIVDAYRSRELAHIVIYGTFSKAFIDRLCVDLGDKEVTAINLTRNPSVQYQLYGFMRDVTQEDPRIPNTTDLLITSIVNNYTLKKLSYVSTTKYEDAVKNGFIKFAGYTVPTPSELSLYNQYITPQEKELLVEEKPDTTGFNNKINSPGIPLNTPQLPSDIFEGLEYQPLMFGDIVAPLR